MFFLHRYKRYITYKLIDIFSDRYILYDDVSHTVKVLVVSHNDKKKYKIYDEYKYNKPHGISVNFDNTYAGYPTSYVSYKYGVLHGLCVERVRGCAHRKIFVDDDENEDSFICYMLGYYVNGKSLYLSCIIFGKESKLYQLKFHATYDVQTILPCNSELFDWLSSTNAELINWSYHNSFYKYHKNGKVVKTLYINHDGDRREYTICDKNLTYIFDVSQAYDTKISVIIDVNNPIKYKRTVVDYCFKYSHDFQYTGPINMILYIKPNYKSKINYRYSNGVWLSRIVGRTYIDENHNYRFNI